MQYENPGPAIDLRRFSRPQRARHSLRSARLRGVPRFSSLSTARSQTMADSYENPMGLMGFEFIEFASPTPNTLEPVFQIMGFSKVANHRSKNVSLYRQGGINLILNNEPHSLAAYFAAEHG